MSKPMRVSKEFEEFMEKARNDIARNLCLPRTAVSQAVTTQKIAEWASLGQKVERKFKINLKKQPNALEKLNNDIEKLLNSLA